MSPTDDFTPFALYISCLHFISSSNTTYRFFIIIIMSALITRIISAISTLLCPLLSSLPLNWKIKLNVTRVYYLTLWYLYFPTPSSKHLCRVCKETLQKKSGGQHQMGFISPSELCGQEQFEIYGQVNCPHHASVQSLKNSADGNCMICSRVWSSLEDHPDQRQGILEALDLGDGPLTYCHITEAGHVDYDLYTRGGINCLLVSVGFPEHVFPDAPKPATFILLPSFNMVVSTHWRLPSYSTNSAQSWYYAKAWYETCLERHEDCNRKRREQVEGGQWYPTRLIKISRWSNKLRLIVTDEERPNGPYLTLSHCWGKADFIQLTQSSMSGFRKDIPYRELPKTFQDAISVAQRLGIYHIWIDSLCIIQREQSLADWKLEAPKMDKVYSHAALNIAATGASDSSKGLFFPRRAEVMDLPEIRLDWSFRVKSSIRYSILDRDYWKRLVMDEPLIRRAWVVQERLLAPRVLHFGSRQLFWECSGCDASEDYPVGLPVVLLRSDQQSLFKFFDETVLKLVESSHPTPAHAVWQRALSSYTHASLTNSEDKLIALAGIAGELSPILFNSYVAGLWKEYMATELLWYVNPGCVSSRQQKYRAPSFSWASVDGAVIPGGWQKDDILIHVEDAFASTEMSSPFGSVDSGFVRLRGTLKRATLWPNPTNTAEFHVPRDSRARLLPESRRGNVGTFHCESTVERQRWLLQLKDIHAPSNVEPTWHIYLSEVYYDQPTMPEMVEYMLMLGTDVYLDQDPFPDRDSFSDETPFSDPEQGCKDVYCMVVTGQSLSLRAVRGLILEPTRREEGEYRRLGVFMTSHGDTMNVLGVPHRSEETIPCKEYDPVTHEHTIVIV